MTRAPQLLPAARFGATPIMCFVVSMIFSYRMVLSVRANSMIFLTGSNLENRPQPVTKAHSGMTILRDKKLAPVVGVLNQ